MPAKYPPLAISHREKNAQRIAALDERAEALGLRPGLGVADARAMHPSLEIIEANPEANRRLLTGLADWCDRYTPLVALDGDDGLFLDITGCAHLFGGEEKMMEDILSPLLAQGFDARAGLASCPGAAWAAARFLSPSVIPPGGEADALAPLPLSALRIDPDSRAGLESVGLHTAGAILDAPRIPLARRFGADLMRRLDQALGRSEEPISPRLPVPPLSAERQLAEPVATAEDIESLTHMLAVTLRQDLERRGEGADALQLSLFRVDGAVHRHVIRTSLPLREPGLIRNLFHEKLAATGDEVDAGYGFELVRLSVLKASPFAVEQVDLAGESAEGEEGLALFADRVRARLGGNALMQPAPIESHIPERAVRMVPFAVSDKTTLARKKAPPADAPANLGRPIRLFSRPEPVEVIAAEVPEGPPLHFRWRRAMYHVARSEGPERLAPEWWREADNAPTRDYFRVEDAEGRRFWLYRQGLYGAAEEMPRWFMHGIFP
ncbi:DNA polymerase Y family protein [Chelativorans salis]|uniref:DNA polymerase Y family protein n=1 Tax=Chelativorans salis TaxID=2978478 RepID=A0ABT2LP88_9HYPH|nr:DNA polymerase Y family protein [Chelativorans sp. EGI FJ00035]MCT7376372.1 DNA polymerase Y family protein [Chelativorans sp. EGI FJ00035]